MQTAGGLVGKQAAGMLTELSRLVSETVARSSLSMGEAAAVARAGGMGLGLELVTGAAMAPAGPIARCCRRSPRIPSGSGLDPLAGTG